MKAKNGFVIIGVIAGIILIFYSIVGSDSSPEYIRQIEKERLDKNRYMRTSSESPFAGLQEEFKGLNYFPPNEKFRIIASLTPVKEKKVRVLTTNDGKEQRYQEYAYAEFDVDNFKNKLLILEVMEMGPQRGTLLLAFGDGTSANETYGAGRYLDVKKVTGATTIELDFNKAYNPYCAYADKYSCPFPPPENLLLIPIPAGEKNYK